MFVGATLLGWVRRFQVESLFKLASVGMDYAEFHSDGSHVLVPLHALYLETEVVK